MSRLITTLMLMFTATGVVFAQELPTLCVQVPQREAVCPNLLYKRSPIDVGMTNTKQGEVVCICMADFAKIRRPANSQTESVNQQVALSRLAAKVDLSEQDLLTLIRK